MDPVETEKFTWGGIWSLFTVMNLFSFFSFFFFSWCNPLRLTGLKAPTNKLTNFVFSFFLISDSVPCLLYILSGSFYYECISPQRAVADFVPIHRGKQPMPCRIHGTGGTINAVQSLKRWRSLVLPRVHTAPSLPFPVYKDAKHSNISPNLCSLYPLILAVSPLHAV